MKNVSFYPINDEALIIIRTNSSKLNAESSKKDLRSFEHFPKISNAKNELSANPYIMKKEDIRYVNCAHCGARVRLEEAVDYKHNLIYGEHFHCRDCDPKGVWDCVSHHVDMDVH